MPARARGGVGRDGAIAPCRPTQAALAIVHIANNNMVGALRSVLIERGLDPRDFVLMAFGGAGPPHICDLMTEAAFRAASCRIFPASSPRLASSWPTRGSIGTGRCNCHRRGSTRHGRRR